MRGGIEMKTGSVLLCFIFAFAFAFCALLAFFSQIVLSWLRRADRFPDHDVRNIAHGWRVVGKETLEWRRRMNAFCAVIGICIFIALVRIARTTEDILHELRRKNVSSAQG